MVTKVIMTITRTTMINIIAVIIIMMIMHNIILHNILLPTGPRLAIELSIVCCVH